MKPLSVKMSWQLRLSGKVTLNHGQPTSALLLLIAIPVATVVNALRVFLTGFLGAFVGPTFGRGFMHITEGRLLFLVSLVAQAQGIGDQVAARLIRDMNRILPPMQSGGRQEAKSMARQDVPSGA